MDIIIDSARLVMLAERDTGWSLGESAVVNFMADHEAVFQYYCKYHLPVMVGQLQVVP